tara:strand:- start:8348 stop:8536 length:189 start_codon:yes stop_codon:yes gene_type:complete
LSIVLFIWLLLFCLSETNDGGGAWFLTVRPATHGKPGAAVDALSSASPKAAAVNIRKIAITA